MHIFLQPEDVLLFRDGRPFNRGEDHHASSVFPPLPSVMQGAIRSHYLVYKGIPLDNKKRIEETVGTASDYRNLRVRGPFLATYDDRKQKLTRYFPAPADAFAMDEKGKSIQKAVLQKNSGSNSHTNLNYLLFRPAAAPKTKKKGGGWLSEAELMNYFLGKIAQVTPEKDLFVRENRLGIALEEKSRSSKDQMLYQADFIRPCDGIGLYLNMEGYPDWPKTGMMRIGGEGHGVYFSEVSAPEGEVKPPQTLPLLFQVYFATPAYFSNGWQPKTWETFFAGDVNLETVALSGSLVLGGFDYAKSQDKAAVRYVPAGSVYYFSHTGGAKLQPNLMQNALTEAGAQIGFGQVLISEWKKGD